MDEWMNIYIAIRTLTMLHANTCLYTDVSSVSETVLILRISVNQICRIHSNLGIRKVTTYSHLTCISCLIHIRTSWLKIYWVFISSAASSTVAYHQWLNDLPIYVHISWKRVLNPFTFALTRVLTRIQPRTIFCRDLRRSWARYSNWSRRLFVKRDG